MKKLAALLTLSLILSMSACNTSSNEPSGSSSAGSSEEEIVIKFGYTPGDLPPEESREVAYATAFKEYVEANSDSIRVELYGSDTLGSANDVVGAIAAGTVQMGVYDFSLLNNYHQDTMVFAMPGAYQDNAEVNVLADTQGA